MKKYIIFILCLIFIVAGCSNNKEKTNPENQAAQLNQEESTEHNHDSGEEHHHDSNLQIEFHTHNSIKVNEKANLSAHIQNEKVPLTEANVRFEIWKDSSQAHDYVDAIEEGDGAYSATKQIFNNGYLPRKSTC